MDIRLKDIPNIPTPEARHLDGLFVVKQDSEDEGRYFDLTDTVFFDSTALDASSSKSHEVVSGDNLYTISRTYYKTTKLWWIIASVNGIDNPFDIKKMVGEVILIPSNETTGDVVSFIGNLN